VLSQVAVSAKRQKVLGRIIAPPAPPDLVVDLEVFQRVIMGLWPTLGNENQRESPLYNLRSVER